MLLNNYGIFVGIGWQFVRDDYVFSELEFLSPARVLGLLIIFMIC